MQQTAAPPEARTTNALRERVFRNDYEGYALRWEHETDDRRVFFNLYNQVLTSIRETHALELSAYSAVALIESWERSEATLDRIIGYFTGQIDRNGHFKKNPEQVI